MPEKGKWSILEGCDPSSRAWLEKPNKQGGGLEKSTPQDPQEAAGLEKSTASGPDGLEKSSARTSSLEKPHVIIDWHYTLEVDDQVSDDNIKALRALMEKCRRVTVLSYVASSQRAQQVQQDIEKPCSPPDIQKAWKSHLLEEDRGRGQVCPSIQQACINHLR